MTALLVEQYKGLSIYMKGIHHFECPKLKLYGYSSVRTLKNAIDKELKKKEA